MTHAKRMSTAPRSEPWSPARHAAPAAVRNADHLPRDERYVIVEPPEFDDDYVDAAYEAGIAAAWDPATEH